MGSRGRLTRGWSPTSQERTRRVLTLPERAIREVLAGNLVDVLLTGLRGESVIRIPLRGAVGVILGRLGFWDGVAATAIGMHGHRSKGQGVYSKIIQTAEGESEAGTEAGAEASISPGSISSSGTTSPAATTTASAKVRRAGVQPEDRDRSPDCRPGLAGSAEVDPDPEVEVAGAGADETPSTRPTPTSPCAGGHHLIRDRIDLHKGRGGQSRRKGQQESTLEKAFSQIGMELNLASHHMIPD